LILKKYSKKYKIGENLRKIENFASKKQYIEMHCLVKQSVKTA